MKFLLIIPIILAAFALMAVFAFIIIAVVLGGCRRAGRPCRSGNEGGTPWLWFGASGGSDTGLQHTHHGTSDAGHHHVPHHGGVEASGGHHCGGHHAGMDGGGHGGGCDGGGGGHH